jgi:cobalt-zinc-cadmium efflux system outer membrane protein
MMFMRVTTLRLAIHWMVLLVLCGPSMAQASDPVTRRPLGKNLTSHNTPGDPVNVREPAGELKLRDALALAIEHNPRLVVFSWDIRASEAAWLQAGVWPNPEIGFEYENIAGSGDFEGVDGAEATLTLSQLVELGGKRGKRDEVARLDNVMANWDYETARIETYAATVSAFVNVLAAQEQIALTEKIADVTRDIQQAVSTRVRAGGTLALEESRARVAVESSLIEKNLAARRLTVARRELAAMWGSSAPQFTRADGALDVIGGQTPALDELLSRVDENPQVARWTAELELRRARTDLVKAHRSMDLNIMAGLRHDNTTDDVGLVFGLSTPIPAWDRKSGAIREAEHLASQVGPARHAAATEVRHDIAIAYEMLAGAQEEIISLRDRVLPDAEQAADRSGAAYRAGAIQLTDVLDIQRTFFHFRVQYVNALARYHSAIAELEGLVGEPITRGDGAAGKERE